MEGATKATITMQGAGYSAVALGLIVATDFGDAPESYGYAGSLFQPTWKGGEVTATTDAFGVSPQAEMYMDRGAPRLGERIDAEGYQKFSADAQADDTNAIFDDEDSIDLTQWGIVTGPGQSHTERVACEGTGKIAAWIDWNNNGAFDDAEKSNEVACDNASNSATLTWTVPADVTNTKRSVDGEPGSRPDSYMRVRITNDNGGDGQRPVGITSTGEVEDYKVSIRVPTLQLTKGVDNTYASAEVPGLGADQWTVTGTGANDTISGAGTTGDPQAVAAGQVALSESSDNPDAAGYEAGQWTCAETEGTVAETGKPYSSSVGQSTDGAASLTVNNEDRVSCTITNTAKPGSLSWSKVDAQGAELAGSAWALTGPEVPADTVVADCAGASCPAGDYLDQDPAAGRFRLTGLKWGTYAIRETTAPAGYAAASGEFSFTQIRGSALEGTLVPAEGVAGNGVVNQPLVGSVTWTKVDADNAKPLSGSTWTLTGPGVPAGTVVNDCAQAPCPTDPFTDQDPVAGSFKVAALQWSADAYALTEKDPPAGYALDATSHSFTISADALDYAFTASFTNSKTTVPLLPLTGGMGADAFLLTGAALGAVALVAAYVRRRRSQTVQ
jgi:putative LPXTG-motif protein cell wall anchor domain protein